MRWVSQCPMCAGVNEKIMINILPSQHTWFFENAAPFAEANCTLRIRLRLGTKLPPANMNYALQLLLKLRHPIGSSCFTTKGTTRLRTEDTTRQEGDVTDVREQRDL